MMDKYISKYSTCICEILQMESIGIEPREFENVEKDKGFKLPDALRSFYLFAGMQKKVTRVFNRLISPDELEITDGYLVFYEENQSVWVWGIKYIDIQREDPPVYIGVYDKKRALSWVIDKSSISEFCIAMSYWQAVNGGMPYTAFGHLKKSYFKKYTKSQPQLGDFDGFTVHGVPGYINVIFQGSDEKYPEIYVGCNNERTLKKIHDIPVLKWSHISTED